MQEMNKLLYSDNPLNTALPMKMKSLLKMQPSLLLSNRATLRRKIMTKLTQETFDEICTYMNDEIREQVHGELDLPCTPEEFLNRYSRIRSRFR